MKSQDLFSVHRSSKKLNESLQKVFGKKINLENFDLEQLQDARNKLRTQLSQMRGQSGFNENIENDAFHQAQWMLDAINAEIAERDEHIIEAEADDDLVMRVEDFLAGWMDAATDYEEHEVHGELVDLADNFDKHKDIHKLRDEIKGLVPLHKFYKSLLMFLDKEFKKDLAKSEGFDSELEEGEHEVDYKLHQLALYGDEEDIIDALGGDQGSHVAEALKDMMEDLKDELAAKGMNDVMRDEDKMIEMLADKLFDEYGEDGEEYGPMDSRYERNDGSADADALKSAGFGSDEDYESVQYESRVDEKAVSKAQQRAAGIALAAKRKGKTPPGKGAAAEMAKMSIKELEKYAGTKHKGLPAKKDESVEQGEDMTTLREGEVQQASAIVTAKTMVDRVGRWIEELSGMENETLLQLGDSIRDEMGQEQAKAFIEGVAPAIQQALETLKGTRDTLSSSVRSLASGEQPADMLGAEPAVGGEEEMPAAEPDAMNAGDTATDDFAAAEPAAGGAEEAGREQRESIQYQHRLLKVLAG